MTAELAIALPSVVLLVALLLTTASVAAAQLRCADAARTGARLAAVGLSDPEVRAAAAHVAGEPVEVRVVRDGTWVDVTVRRRLAGSWFTGGPLTPVATASAWVEQ